MGWFRFRVFAESLPYWRDPIDGLLVPGCESEFPRDMSISPSGKLAIDHSL
jgi:hypothetical protein